MSDTKLLYTLITGASIGLGKELALECARRKMNLILVSLPGEDIEGLSQEIGIERYLRQCQRIDSRTNPHKF